MNRAEKNIWSNNGRELPKINYEHQTTHPGASENTKQDKHQKRHNKSYTIQTIVNQRKRQNVKGP